MKIYNTLHKQVEEFVPNKPGEVTIYTCGPTVYHYAHIGNLRCYIFEDILEKSFEYLGYKVTRAMNITDVGHLTSDADTGEDKMLKGAKRENKTVWEVAEFYTQAFLRDIERLNIRVPEILVKATDYVPKYIDMITHLLNIGHAYLAGGNVYYDVSKAKNYYQLSGMNAEELKEAAREEITSDAYKKNPADFVLWFTVSKFENQAMQWESPWGRGYPGWHIECSGIAIDTLGEHLDIHCGGVDNIFPHHTNEIAQSESCLGHHWCNYWMHGAHLVDKNGKMSKSSGEFLTLPKLEEHGYDPLVYRYFCLGSHYRNPLSFSFDHLDQATNAYQKLKNKILSLKTEEIGNSNNEKIEYYQTKFKEALENDLNTSSALTTLYDVLKEEELSDTDKLELIQSFDLVFGLSLTTAKKIELTEEQKHQIEGKIEIRNRAKKEKNFALADQIRDALLEDGIVIKDTREGTTYEMKN